MAEQTVTDSEKRAYLLSQGWEHKAEGGPDTLAWWKDGIFWFEIESAWQAQLEIDAAAMRQIRARWAMNIAWHEARVRE